jgi:hypothetical protein
MPSNNAKESLKQFISVRPLFIHIYGQFVPDSVNPQRDPNTDYIFDSERDASQSEICRQSKNKECIIVGFLSSRKSSPDWHDFVDTFCVGGGGKLQMTSRELFAAMQVRVSHLSSLFTAPHSGLLRRILSPWCHGVDSDRVVVV